MGDANSYEIQFLSSQSLQFYNPYAYSNLYRFLTFLSDRYFRFLELESNIKQKYMSEVKKETLDLNS